MTKTETIELIHATCVQHGITLPKQQAYVLATVEHETNATFRPVREAYWLSEKWREEHLRYFPFYGRGYVQITWERNYRIFGNLLDIDLVAEPDLAMEPAIAAFILVVGFRDGLFTGKKISDYITRLRTDYVGARRCINGTDKAGHIADLVKHYL